MHRSLLALAIALNLACAPAYAGKKSQNIDFSDVTCGQFVAGLSEMDEQSAGIVLVWLDGYLSGVSGDTVLNWNNLESIGKDLVEYCGKHEDESVLDAAKEVGID
jgi:acid stress chaperone HdeB